MDFAQSINVGREFVLNDRPNISLWRGRRLDELRASSQPWKWITMLIRPQLRLNQHYNCFSEVDTKNGNVGDYAVPLRWNTKWSWKEMRR
jgi:hypothetical protein